MNDRSVRDHKIEKALNPYDLIATQWRNSRRDLLPREVLYLNELVSKLSDSAHILDVGCGTGIPIARFILNRGFRLTGLDSSPSMLAIASTEVPEARLLHGDMVAFDLDERFDAIVAWDCVFHVDRARHAAVFANFAKWLLPGGWLLLSIGGTAEAGFTSDMHGQTFFYSGHDPAQAAGLLERAGIKIERMEIDDPSDRGHVAILAQRKHESLMD